MIKFVSGPRDAGKTATMVALYKKDGLGDGFVSLKDLENGKAVSYRLQRLASGETVPLAYDFRRVPPDWQESTRHGRYSFGVEGLEFAETILNDLLGAGVQPIYLDEIGKLELEGGGFAGLLEKAVSSGLDLVIAVRDINVEAVAERFGIEDYTVHPVK